jgi:recombination protein RecT
MTTEITKAAQQAPVKKQDSPLRSLLNSEKTQAELARVLPKHLTPDRVARCALTAMTRIPDLAECDPLSFMSALMTLSQLGLEPDGRLAHLIPFKNKKRGCTECQLIIDYKGLVALAMRSGIVSTIHADVVCDNDTFAYDKGEIVTHRIDFKASRGSVYAVYVIITMKDGSKKAEVMAKYEVDSIRARSHASDSGPWVTDYNEMAKKTVFKRCSKYLVLSSEFRDAVAADDEQSGVVIDIPSANPRMPQRDTESMSRALRAPTPEPTSEPQQETLPIEADPEPEAKQTPAKEESAIKGPHPSIVLAEKAIKAGLSFDELRDWNLAQPSPFPGLNQDAIGFDSLSRTQANAILRVWDHVLTNIKEGALQ